MTTALIGLGGVAVGALASLAGTWLSVGHQRRSESRAEVRELVSGFWATTDRVWRSAQAQTITDRDMQIAAHENSPRDVERYRQQHQDARSQLHEANAEALHQVAILRILYPTIALQATVLLARSAEYDFTKREQMREARSQALTDFETTARTLIQGVPGWKRHWRRLRYFRRTRQAQKLAAGLADRVGR